jgi:hypothetical protein
MAQAGTVQLRLTPDSAALVREARRRFRRQHYRDLIAASITGFSLGALGMARVLRRTQ